MLGSRLEMMTHLEPFVRDAIPQLTYKEDEYWQPADFLPDFSQADAHERVAALQEETNALSDDLLAVLVGDMITEEALPSYSTWIGQLVGFDKSGEPRNAWGDWLRRWTSEENRHGDVLNRFLYLCGRVNMREVEITIQNLLADGGDTQSGVDPYKTFVYTSFQEIATSISHRNVARLAKSAGCNVLAKLCGNVASDENRHAKAYKLFFSKVLEADPNSALISFYDMMRNAIVMPAMYMRERGAGQGDTFRKFAEVAEQSLVYTRQHYVEILESLINSWGIENLSGLSAEAAKAQDYLASLPERYRKVADRFALRETVNHRFSWILERPQPAPSASA